ncbi:unnamed protein product [Echinostoma caproni]|uniref:YccF domain-containing protein n=1 Tax=Echinostoma caproni TaxID=27848 RepID=A0A183AV25_9TREM|nr:unnamed protein product [Echinostoma caproni]
MESGIRFREIREYKPTTQGETINATSSGDSEPTAVLPRDDDEEEPADDLRPDLDAANKLNQGTAHVPAFIKAITSSLPPKWVNWTVRFFTTIFLISTFSLLVYLGPLALALLVGCMSWITPDWAGCAEQACQINPDLF